MTATLAEADDLIAPRASGACSCRSGHIERFNPAVDVLRDAVRAAALHRGAPAGRVLAAQPRHRRRARPDDPRPRHRAVRWTAREAVQVDAVGVPVLTPRVDIANARLRFASGLIANLTASRVSARRSASSGSSRRAPTSPRTSPPGRPRSTGSSRGGRARHPASTRTSAPDGGAAAPPARGLPARRSATGAARPVVSGEDWRRALAWRASVLDRMADVIAAASRRVDPLTPELIAPESSRPATNSWSAYCPDIFGHDARTLQLDAACCRGIAMAARRLDQRQGFLISAMVHLVILSLLMFDPKRPDAPKPGASPSPGAAEPPRRVVLVGRTCSGSCSVRCRRRLVRLSGRASLKLRCRRPS